MRTLPRDGFNGSTQYFNILTFDRYSHELNPDGVFTTSRIFNVPYRSAHSAGASARHREREQRPAGDEGGERQDGAGEEGDHPGALPLAGLSAAAPHRRDAAALTAAVRDRSESDNSAGWFPNDVISVS